ncbi:MAG: hypothetical protein RBU29_13655 [bacterium]|nr:hypothetical protein [bacterium]
MGWGRTFLLGDIGNRLDIEDCEQTIGEMKFHLSQKERLDENQDDRLAALQRENDELKLYLTVITRLLIAKEVIDREEISRLITAIDSEDGQIDGKFDGAII